MELKTKKKHFKINKEKSVFFLYCGKIQSNKLIFFFFSLQIMAFGFFLTNDSLKELSGKKKKEWSVRHLSALSSVELLAKMG